MPKRYSKRNLKSIYISSQKLGEQCLEEIKKFPLQCSVCFNTKSDRRITLSLTMRKNYGNYSPFNLQALLCKKCSDKLKQKFILTKNLKDDPSDLPWSVKIESFLLGDE